MDYLSYHINSSKIKDIDPANDALRYLCDRFELNLEQRYWVAFLYSTCYCAATAYYMYSEFPDFENVDDGRLQRWWNKNKQRCLFQTDRLRIKTSNQFVPTFQSYREWVGDYSQQQKFAQLKTPKPEWTYDQAFKAVTNVRNIGRFTAFIYLEMITVLTDFKCWPKTFDWKTADNCRKGLCYAYNVEDKQTNEMLDGMLWQLQKLLLARRCEHSSVYNIETTLCAYKKYVHGKRHVGYYLERQLAEIDKMAANVPTGVCWDVLYQFRKETYKHLKPNER